MFDDFEDGEEMAWEQVYGERDYDCDFDMPEPSDDELESILTEAEFEREYVDSDEDELPF